MKNTSKVSIVLFFLAISMLSTDSCKEESTFPFVKTNIATSITKTSATTGGNITDDGGSEVTSRGV